MTVRRPEQFDHLPILRELGDDLQRAFQAQEEAERRHDRSAARSRRWRWRPLLVLASVVAVVTPSAVATRPWWAPMPDAHDPAAGTVLSGEMQLAYHADPRWVLSAHSSSRGICLNLYDQFGQFGGCSDEVPDRRKLTVQMKSNGTRGGFVFGVTAPEVRTVRLQIGSRMIEVPTGAPDKQIAKKAAMRTDFKFFVKRVTGPVDPTRPFTAEAIGAQRLVLDRWPRRLPVTPSR